MAKKTLFLPEICNLLISAKTKKEKIQILKDNDSPGFRAFLYLALEPDIKWVFNEKEFDSFEYEKLDIPSYELAPTTLMNLSRRQLIYYTNMYAPALKPEKIRRNMSGILSSLHEEDIAIFRAMVSGIIDKYGIMYDIVKDAFPGLIKDKKVKKDVSNVLNESNESNESNEKKEENPKPTRKKRTTKATKATEKKTPAKRRGRPRKTVKKSE